MKSLVQLSCTCTAYVTNAGTEVSLEVGDTATCPTHEKGDVVFVAWLDPIPLEDPKEWGKQLHVHTAPDYMFDFGMPGISFSEDGDAVIDFGGEVKRVLTRGSA